MSIIIPIIIICALLIFLFLLKDNRIYHPISYELPTTPITVCYSDEESLALIKEKFTRPNFTLNNIFHIWIPFKPECVKPSPRFRKMMDTVIEQNNGWDIFLIGPKCMEYLWLKYNNIDVTTRQLYELYQHYTTQPVQKNDLTRLLLLYIFGGVYVDGDVIANKNFVDLIGSPLDRHSRLIFASSQFVLANYFIASFPTYNHALVELIERLFITTKSFYWLFKRFQWAEMMLTGVGGLKISELFVYSKDLYVVVPSQCRTFSMTNADLVLNDEYYKNFSIVHVSDVSHSENIPMINIYRKFAGKERNLIK